MIKLFLFIWCSYLWKFSNY